MPYNPGAVSVTPPPLLRQASIRALISVLLLLSTLNTVVTGSFAFVLFNTIADSPTQARLELARTTRMQVDALETRVITAAAGGADLDVDTVRTQTGAARDRIDDGEVWTPQLAAEWQAWERELRSVTATIETVGRVDEAQLGALRLAHSRLTGQLLLASDYARPLWVDQLTPFLPWASGWIALVGITTVLMAWSLELLLSRPLTGLAGAADRVGGGDLTQEIPVRPAVPEVERLARAIAGMRDRLVRTIADVETRAADMETILGNLSDGVLLLDRDGRIVELNRAAQRLLAPPSASRIVEGRLLTQGEAPPTEGAPIERWLPELRGVEGDAEIEVSRELASGTRWFEVATSRVPAGRVVVIRDKTQEREVEKVKRDFLSVITHELKTPLTPIEGYARLLQLGKGGPLTDKQQEFVGVIHAQAGILKSMVQNLLDANRLEGGTLPIHPQECEIRGFVEQVGQTWRGNTETRGIQFALDNRIPAGLTVTVDPFRLEQVIGNLMSNAGKFTPQGGTITLGGHPVDGGVRLYVADTGRGIPPEALARVFEKFYQVERGDTRAAGGAGLGLYIVRSLVEAMGGTISVESSPGVGSRFEIHFPSRGTGA